MKGALPDNQSWQVWDLIAPTYFKDKGMWKRVYIHNTGLIIVSE